MQDAGKVVVPLLEDGNLVDKAWGADRPAAPTVPLRVHDIKVRYEAYTKLLESCGGGSHSQMYAHPHALPPLICFLVPLGIQSFRRSQDPETHNVNPVKYGAYRTLKHTTSTL